MKVGSLFSGYRGLDCAVERFFGAETVWWSDIDPGAIKINEHHWPDQPNLGDITTVDWSQVEPVDILTGGFPCQDLSHAGKRAGMHDGTRSGLWSHMAEAIHQLRPRYVIAENVRGLLSASATSDLEPCPWCLGGAADGEPALRALGCVLGDLADLGYDTRWVGLRAADVGAPHGRFRVFIVATDTTSRNGRTNDGKGWKESGRDGRTSHTSSQPGSVGDGDDVRPRRGALGRGQTAGRGVAADSDSLGRQRGGSSRERWPGPAHRGLAAADATGDGWDEGRPEPARFVGGPDAAERRCWYCGEPTTGEFCGNCSAHAPADAERLDIAGRRRIRDLGSSQTDSPSEALQRQRDRDAADHRGAVDWEAYEPAIRRWERILGRVAPAPTETSTRGSQRLSPRFVEWLMGLPADHVTGVPGLGRNAQLKALGNGVVPQQAYAALQALHETRAAA